MVQAVRDKNTDRDKRQMIFTVELAGVPIRVHCLYEENRDFLRDYLTDRDPVLTVEPTEEDCRRIRLGLERMAAKEGGAGGQVYDDSFLENNAIHALIADGLVRRGVLLFHGSAICMDGQAVIFTAPSGTGKSTQARLWREAFGDRAWMINDDKPLLRIESEGAGSPAGPASGREEKTGGCRADAQDRTGRILVCGSPWDGKHRLSRNACAPLKAVLAVTRSPENHIERMSQADAFQTMMEQGYLPDDPLARMQVLTLGKKVLQQTPFFRLYCNQEPEAAWVAWRGLTGREEKEP